MPRSLFWATDLDVLAPDHEIERREGYLAVRSPSNPGFWWGNLLLFDGPPQAGDRARWESAFAAEFAGRPKIRHRTFAWDRVDGTLGAAREEFVAHGYDLEEKVGLVAAPDQLRPHPRANRDVVVRMLDPQPGADEAQWAQVIELQMAVRDTREPAQAARAHLRRRQADLRALFCAGRGAWYVAENPSGRQVLASCGVVVTHTRGRFQAVDTAEAYRRRGICSRLVVEAAQLAARGYGARRLVIAADPHYHALGLYESLGFEPVERVAGVCRPPRNTVSDAE